MRDLSQLLDQRIAVLDGAWGTTFQSRSLTAADYRLPGHDQDTAGDQSNIQNLWVFTPGMLTFSGFLVAWNWGTATERMAYAEWEP